MSLPYFNMYPTDFEADTSHLSLAEDGAYNRLLRLMWMTPDCSLPDDSKWIMRRLRVDQETFDNVVAIIIEEFFQRKKGRLSNARLTKEFVKSNASHLKRKNAGKLGGSAKSMKNNEKAYSNAKAKPKQPKPKPKPEPIDKISNEIFCRSEVFEAIAIWKEETQSFGLPQPLQKPSPKREKAIAARVKENGLEVWRDACRKLVKNPFNLGEKGWKADIDYLARPDGFQKTIEYIPQEPRRTSSAPKMELPKTQLQALAALRDQHARDVQAGNFGYDDQLVSDASSGEPRRIASARG